MTIEIVLQNGDRLILATNYCPNLNPSMQLFRKIHALSNHVMFSQGTSAQNISNLDVSNQPVWSYAGKHRKRSEII